MASTSASVQECLDELASVQSDLVAQREAEHHRKEDGRDRGALEAEQPDPHAIGHPPRTERKQQRQGHARQQRSHPIHQRLDALGARADRLRIGHPLHGAGEAEDRAVLVEIAAGRHLAALQDPGSG